MSSHTNVVNGHESSRTVYSETIKGFCECPQADASPTTSHRGITLDGN